MIDHALGRPSPSWKRLQVVLVILFWLGILRKGPRDGPSVIRRWSARLAQYSPWQLAVGLATASYAFKNIQHVLGLAAPEPMSRLYSRSYYRATWLVTALDAGFATAMHVRPEWLRHILSLVFAQYYLFYAEDADEKVRRYRAFCSVEFMRTTWNKTANPIIRFVTKPLRPDILLHRRLEIARPQKSHYERPIVVELFFDGTEEQLRSADELVYDIPGGGFISQSPLQHDERLLRWAKRLKRPILALDYRKAPEFPFPYAIYEVLDLYKLLVKTNGGVIGMHPDTPIKMVVSGDSAGANLATAAMFKVLEMPANEAIAKPVGLVYTYPALNFNFNSWMPREDLRVLRQEESTAHLASIAQAKGHLSRASPLTVVGDDTRKARVKRRNKSWSRSFGFAARTTGSGRAPGVRPSSLVMSSLTTPPKGKTAAQFSLGSESGDDDEDDSDPEETRALAERVQEPSWIEDINANGELHPNAPLTTRLTMSSRTSFFSDRIITPTMMRAMAILYVGPISVDLATNYYISPLLAPASLLAKMPPIHLVCGEKDPLVDDTVVLAGRIREARRQASGLHDGILDDGHVTLRLVEGWSHGFLQMISLLPGVAAHIDSLSDAIQGFFERAPSSSPALQLSNVIGAPKNTPTPPLSGLVETADLLKRRRMEAVDGISTAPSGQAAKGTEAKDTALKTPSMINGDLHGMDGYGV